uniref:Putative secreted protein n=1 Tax=Anopheles darlingi TaxID=43151 RepID=A0A2M4D1E1_ANODA
MLHSFFFNTIIEPSLLVVVLSIELSISCFHSKPTSYRSPFLTRVLTIMSFILACSRDSSCFVAFTPSVSAEKQLLIKLFMASSDS